MFGGKNSKKFASNIFFPKKFLLKKNFKKKISPSFWPVSKIRDPLRLSFMAVAIPFGGIILLNTERHLRNACFLRYCQNSFGISDQIHLDDSFLRKFMKLFLHVSETIHPSSSFCIHIEREDILSYLTSCKYRCLFPLFFGRPYKQGFN